MNRNNIWIHVGLATVVVAIAAIFGQIERWKDSLDKHARVAVSMPEPVNNIVRRVNKDAPEVLVRFRPGVSLEQVRAVAYRNNDSLADEIESVNGLTEIDDLDNADPTEVAAAYSAMSDIVQYAEPNYQIKLDDPASSTSAQDLYQRPTAGMPNDPQFGDQWALNNSGQDGGKERADIDALKAWARSTGSEDVVVAVLDSGVDYTHVDLRSNIWLRPDSLAPYTDDELGVYNDLYGFNGTDRIADPMDDNGHGTHCAGIIGAEGDNNEGIAGVNWTVRIMPLKFLGRGGFGNTDDAIEAINYAIQRKKDGVNIRVISASWGSTQRSQALEDVIRAAGEAGILFIAAAGNDNSDNDRSPHYPSNYDLPNVVSVAALDRNDQLAGFSNYGVNTVHIAAPGKDIVSTWLGDNYRAASGTSMATPYVSGVAALIVAENPDITVEKLRSRLLRSVDKIDSLSGKVATGGRINAAKAIGN